MLSQEVYTLALRAKYFWNRKFPGDAEKAMEYYQRALDIDPGYAPAWAGLSASYLHQVLVDGRISALAKAREAVEKALSLDPDLSDAHVRKGILHIYDHNRKAAFEEYRQALALDPNNPLAMAVMSTMWQEGHLDEAINWYKKAAIIDPLTTTWPTNMSKLLTKAGRLDEAEDAARKALELSPEAIAPSRNLAVIFLLRGQLDEALELIQSLPDSDQNTLILTIIYHAMGRQDESDAALMRLTGAAGEEEEDLFLMAQAHAGRGEIDKAFEWLEKTNDAHLLRYGVNEEPGVFKFQPFLENLHDDPRWDALLDKLDMPD
jgi:serine/threonine-protein kinase